MRPRGLGRAVEGVELIAAVARNGVIGRDGQLPWHLPDDLRHFKQLTMDHPILMGRRTFESIGRALPGRRNIVITSTSLNVDGVERVTNLREALRLVLKEPRIFIVGGAVLYAAILPVVSVMHLTELDEPVEGDAFFPPFDRSRWRLVSEVPHEKDERHAMSFRFCRYERA